MTKKPALPSPAVVAHPNQLSKAALIDVVCEMLALRAGSASSFAELIREFDAVSVPVLKHRGDRRPRATKGGAR